MQSPGTAAGAPSTRGGILTDRDGNLRTAVILGIIAGAIVILALGSYIGLIAANLGSPETLALWVLAALIVVKLPLLGLVWWILARRRDPAGGGGWNSKECGEILAYLEEQANASAGRSDAAARLAYFSREAWFVADSAADADKAMAVATAMRIDAMAMNAGAGRHRVEPSGR